MTDISFLIIGKDYDEFKDFVAVSQLAPISSSEMGQLFVQRQQQSGTSSSSTASKGFGSNKICKDSSDLYDFDLNANLETTMIENHGTTCKAQENTTKNIKDKVPRNALEFEREWRQCWAAGSPATALKYLLLPKGEKLGSIFDCHEHGTKEAANRSNLTVPKELRLSPEDIVKLHKIEMNSTTMEEIIEILYFYIAPFVTSAENPIVDSSCMMASSFVYRWMTSLTKCGRFSLSIQFFDAKHKALTHSILRLLEKEATNGCQKLQLGEILNLIKSYKKRSHV